MPGPPDPRKDKEKKEFKGSRRYRSDENRRILNPMPPKPRRKNISRGTGRTKHYSGGSPIQRAAQRMIGRTARNMLD